MSFYASHGPGSALVAGPSVVTLLPSLTTQQPLTFEDNLSFAPPTSLMGVRLLRLTSISPASLTAIPTSEGAAILSSTSFSVDARVSPPQLTSVLRPSALLTSLHLSSGHKVEKTDRGFECPFCDRLSIDPSTFRWSHLNTHYKSQFDNIGVERPLPPRWTLVSDGPSFSVIRARPEPTADAEDDRQRKPDW